MKHSFKKSGERYDILKGGKVVAHAKSEAEAKKLVRIRDAMDAMKKKGMSDKASRKEFFGKKAQESYSEQLELLQTSRARDVLEHYTYRKVAGGWEAIKHENGKSKVAFRVKGSLAKAKADGRNREKFEHMK